MDLEKENVNFTEDNNTFLNPIEPVEPNESIEFEASANSGEKSLDREDEDNNEPRRIQLPLNRVKRIIKVDPEVKNCSNLAAIMITLATEEFIRYFVSKAETMMRVDKRRTLQYRHISNTVTRIEQLEFLMNLLPREVVQKTSATRTKSDKRAQNEVIRETPPLENIGPVHEDTEMMEIEHENGILMYRTVDFSLTSKTSDIYVDEIVMETQVSEANTQPALVNDIEDLM